MPMIKHRSAVWLGAIVALTALAVTGCGVGTDRNGLEKKSTAEVQQAAAAALKAAESIHLKGTGRYEGKPVRVDLRVRGGASAGTIGWRGSEFEMTAIGDYLYLKADKRAWQALGAPPAVSGAAGRWVKLRPAQVINRDLLSVDRLTSQLTSDTWQQAPTVDKATLDGKKVVVLSQANGAKLYVANTGAAYPIRMDIGPDGGRLDFTDYGTDFQITPPTDGLSNDMTAKEVAWLEAVGKLNKKMYKIFNWTGNVAMTRAKMKSWADTLRSCSSELARIGSPSDRLQPVHALVRRACAEHDRASQCFAKAAQVSSADGSVIVGTVEDRAQARAIECGGAGADDGNNLLGDAEAEGREITESVAFD